MSGLSHIDPEGKPRMVDVGEKDVTSRTAVAEGHILMSEKTAEAVSSNSLSKGNVLVTAEWPPRGHMN